MFFSDCDSVKAKLLLLHRKYASPSARERAERSRVQEARWVATWQEEPQRGLNLRLSSFHGFGEEPEQDRDQCWRRAALLVRSAQPQALPLERLLVPSVDIDNAPSNSASVATLSPAASPAQTVN